MPKPSLRQELPALLVCIGIVVSMAWPRMPAIAIGFPIAMVMLWAQPVVFVWIDRRMQQMEGEE